MEKESILHKIISFIFINMTNKYKCLTEYKKESWNIKGTNLGGLFVLEPWITPSLFYQFLNKKDSNKVAMDTYTFCKVLGPVEGKRQLDNHFSMWVNETHIHSLSLKKISHLRIPVGDWMFQPYGPYIGCTDNSIRYLNKVLNLCKKYSIKVLLDLHGVKDSQNGLDNSGQSSNIEYVVSPINKEYDSTLTFIHWPIIAGNWIGKFDNVAKNYSSINYNNIQFTKNVLYQMIDMYKNHPAVFAIEPLNEPWIYTPSTVLKDFYYDIYKYMNFNAPRLKFIFHDSFRDSIWKGFLNNCSNVAIDWHIYQAWNVERYGDQFLLEADNYKTYINKIKSYGLEVVVGEFSLATDNCALWLNGFQDNLEGYPMTPCMYAPCPFPYIDIKDINRVKNIISPFGTGLSTPMMGTCPYEGLVLIDEDKNSFLKKLNLKKLSGFETSHGWFFWNFQTEFELEVGWNFEKSYELGYFKGNDIDPITTDYYFLGGMFLLLSIFTGLIVTIVVLCKKKQIKEYQYVEIEVPSNEINPINKYKVNASTGNIPKYNSINV